MSRRTFTVTLTVVSKDSTPPSDWDWDQLLRSVAHRVEVGDEDMVDDEDDVIDPTDDDDSGGFEDDE